MREDKEPAAVAVAQVEEQVAYSDGLVIKWNEKRTFGVIQGHAVDLQKRPTSAPTSG